MQKKYIFATTAAVVVLLAGAFTYKVYAEKNNGVAAVVNGEQITVADIKEAYEQTPQIKNQVSFEEFYNRALEVMINSKLALQAATAANVQASQEYQKELAAMQDDLARKVYIDQQLATKVTDAEIKKVYDDLAKQYSKDQADLGYFTAEAMVPEFSDAAFAMKKGTFSQKPVKTEFGYHVILVEDVRDSKPLPFENVAEQIKGTLSQQAVAQVVADLHQNAQIEKFDLNGKKITEEEKK